MQFLRIFLHYLPRQKFALNLYSASQASITAAGGISGSSMSSTALIHLPSIHANMHIAWIDISFFCVISAIYGFFLLVAMSGLKGALIRFLSLLRRKGFG